MDSTKGRLFLNTISDDFDHNKDIAAGPWCFVGQENVWPTWWQQEFFMPFSTKDERGKHAEATRWQAHQLIHKLAKQLNQRHMTEYTDEFWHRLLINWALHLTQGMWKLYKIVEDLIEKHGNKPLTIQVIHASSLPTIMNTSEFIENFYVQKSIIFVFLSEIIKELKPPNWHLDFIDHLHDLKEIPQPAIQSRPNLHNIPGIRRRRDFLFRWILSSLLEYKKKSKLRALLKQPATQPDFPFPSQYQTILQSCADWSLPDSFTSAFLERDQKIKQHPRRAGRVKLGFINFQDDNELLESAHSLVANEHVISVQHGGGYGWAGAFTMMAECEYNLSAFLTWGWTRHNDYQGNFIPTPSPFLSRHSHQRKNDEMLMMGAVMFKFNPRIDQYPDPIRYRSYKMDLLSKIKPHIRKVSKYRPYNPIKHFADGEFICAHFPEMSIHEGLPQQGMLQCKLLVVDHASTPLCQALAWNIPTVAFWDHSQWFHSEDGSKMFNLLKEAGILYDDPVEAAEHINKIWDNVEEWWNNDDLQNARRAWVKQYAYSSRFWWFHWFKKIWHF